MPSATSRAPMPSTPGERDGQAGHDDAHDGGDGDHDAEVGEHATSSQALVGGSGHGPKSTGGGASPSHFLAIGN